MTLEKCVEIFDALLSAEIKYTGRYGEMTFRFMDDNMAYLTIRDAREALAVMKDKIK